MTTWPLCLKDYAHVVILTGAGVSAASGLATFRGPGGLYETDPSLVEAVLVDIEAPSVTDHRFDDVIVGPAEDIIPDLLA